MSDTTQSPEPADEQPPADRPAALEPDPSGPAEPATEVVPAQTATEVAPPSTPETGSAPAEPSTLGDADALPVEPPPPAAAASDAPASVSESLPPPPPPPTPDWAPASASAADTSSPLTERPELAVGAAFAGGLVVALILKRLAR